MRSLADVRSRGASIPQDDEEICLSDVMLSFVFRQSHGSSKARHDVWGGARNS